VKEGKEAATACSNQAKKLPSGLLDQGMDPSIRATGIAPR
jgi:hypothetical protein